MTRPEHPGLLFFRYFGEFKEQHPDSAAKAFVVRANEIYTGPAYHDLLNAINARQQLATAHRFAADVIWRLTVGLSYGRLWDVGLQFHPLYGVPYLPASGIKGALRHWALEAGDDGKECTDQIDLYFGTTERQASVLLFDAFPLPGNGKLLAEDVLNKHHTGYYESGKGKEVKPPADYDTPQPVKFMTVARGVRFHLAFTIRTIDTPPAAADVKKLILQCVKYAGLGAKTAKGYGRMRAK